MQKITQLKLCAENMSFSVAHFALFSATQRERLHGHNYRVQVLAKAPINSAGICFDCEILQRAVVKLCEQLNLYLLLPAKSPYLTIRETEKNYIVIFNQDEMSFLKTDTQLMPLTNITIESLAAWFLQELRLQTTIQALDILRLVVRVSNIPGRWADSEWRLEK